MTLDDLVALCDEMAALTLAGVPLDRGLQDLARELPGKLGRTSKAIGADLERGGDLAGYLREHEKEFSPAFAAVVEAGLRVGRLPAALEDLARSARRMAGFQRSLLAAWVYPLVVVFIAWMLLRFMLLKIFPVMYKAHDELGITDNPLMTAIANLGGYFLKLDGIIPLVVVLYFSWALWAVGRADPTGASLRWWSLGVVGPVLQLRRASQLASFTDLLALLIEHLVPLPEALRLAAHSSPSRGLAPAVNRLADALECGQTAELNWSGCPPLLNWLLAHPPPAGELGPALRLLADEYAAGVERQTNRLSWYGPLVLTALVGGTTTALYCVLVAGPWISVLYAYVRQAVS